MEGCPGGAGGRRRAIPHEGAFETSSYYDVLVYEEVCWVDLLFPIVNYIAVFLQSMLDGRSD